MSTTDYIIPALSLGLILIEVFLDDSPKFKRFALICIGVLTFGFSFWAAWQNSDDVKELKDHANLILDGRRSDSINNAEFQIYLKDTFGLERKGNSAIITNTVTIKNILNNILEAEPKQNQDSTNVYFKFSNKNLYVAPKSGTWAHAYYMIDTGLAMQNLNMINEGYGIMGVTATFEFDGKKIDFGSGRLYDRAVFIKEPMHLDLSGAPYQYIIFGDQGFPDRRWIFKDGKVKWYPER